MTDNSTAKAVLFSESKLPTEFGVFRILSYKDRLGNDVPVLATPNKLNPPVHLRIHSSCITGDIFFSERCDCRAQLSLSEKIINESQNGLIIYLHQEGRGIGFGNKIKAYAAQDKGLDTYAANREIGFDDDLRNYQTAVDILRAMGISAVHLITNNPEKMQALTAAGISVVSCVPCITEPGANNRSYLLAKKNNGHLLPDLT